MGIDAFLEIDSWKNYRDLFPLCNFIVMNRPGYALPPPTQLIPRQLAGEFTFLAEGKRYLHISGSSVFIVDIPGLAISSLEIRNRAARGQSITYLVPRAVEAYMREHRLYHNADTGS